MRTLPKEYLVFLPFMIVLLLYCQWQVDDYTEQCAHLFLSVLSLLLISTFLSLLPRFVSLMGRAFYYVMAYAAAFMDVICRQLTGSGVSPATIQLLSETNCVEIEEFFFTYGAKMFHGSAILWIILLWVFNMLAEYCVPNKPEQRARLPLKLATALLCIVVFSTVNLTVWKSYLSEQYMEEIEFHWTEGSMPTTPSARVAVSAIANFMNRGHVKKLIRTNASAYIAESSPQDLQVVLIIGESYNKHHSQLYGYEKPTTPRQLKRFRQGEMLVFSHASSPFNLTSPALKNMLSLNSLADKETWWVTYTDIGRHI